MFYKWGCNMELSQSNSITCSNGLFERTGTVDIKEDNIMEKSGHDKLIGQTLQERYRLLKIIGEGAMGVVFEAIDEVENKHVAIKLLFSEIMTKENAKKRFYREAKTGMALTHPNIVKTYHYGEVDDVIFISMEYVEGQSLKDYINSQPLLTPQAALPIVEQLCLALDYAHSKGILHRDLKPANMLVCKDEAGQIQVKLADFGIAKLLAPNEDITNGTNLTETGVILGTVNYVAPEYLLGLDLTSVSDIYSLGVIVYQLLTKNSPVKGSSHNQLMYNKVYKDIETPSQSYEFLPESLDPVLKKVLERDPNKRYQTSLEFLQGFKEAVSGIS